MIHVIVKTERVYSHDTSGMPKIELINQTFSDFGFDKFLKYLPYQGYIIEKTKVVGATKDGSPISTEPYQQKLSEILDKLTKPEQTIEDKYLAEKALNESLLERLAAIEAKLSTPVETHELKGTLVDTDELKGVRDSLDDLKAQYEAKYGKKPHHNLSEAKLIEALK